MSSSRQRLVSISNALVIICALGMFVLGGCGTKTEPETPGGTSETGAAPATQSPETDVAGPDVNKPSVSDLTLSKPSIRVTPDDIPITKTDTPIAEEDDLGTNLFDGHRTLTGLAMACRHRGDRSDAIGWRL